MTAVDERSQKLREQFLESLDKVHVAAAASKLLSASIGDMVVVLSRSPAHKHYSLADIEWMVLPPVTSGQFYIAEVARQDSGFRLPVAVVTWALVSEEVDALLGQQAAPSRPLRPDQWNCGEIAWLIDAVGSADGVRAALEWLASRPFKERPLKLATYDAQGARSVKMLHGFLNERSSLGTVA